MSLIVMCDTLELLQE